MRAKKPICVQSGEMGGKKTAKINVILRELGIIQID